jgi:hypothetical protein
MRAQETFIMGLCAELRLYCAPMMIALPQF